MRIPLENVERELLRMWEDEARRSMATRAELLTLVALVGEASQLDRARAVATEVARVHPCRTITASWRPGDPPEITAGVALHRDAHTGAPCGDAIELEAVGTARDWLPENLQRLSLPDVPSCVWWVGDLPDEDDLFDRAVAVADVVIVNSGEMDLRDLEKLAWIADASRDRYALLDLTWVRLRPLQDLVARFFDEPAARPWLDRLARVEVSFVPRLDEKDVGSTQAGLFVGWLAAALGLRGETATWRRDGGAAEVVIERAGAAPVKVRFEPVSRDDVIAGSITRVALGCDAASFEVVRESDPCVFCWMSRVPGASVLRHTVHVSMHAEASLLARGLERPRRDRLLEASLRMGSRIVRPVAPRLSDRPPRVR